MGPSSTVTRHAEAIAQSSQVPFAAALTLARLGIAAEDSAAYLSPSLRDLLPDPRSMRDAGIAARRLIAAVTDRQRIAIFADYDVDGGASAAILLDWLRAFDIAPTIYVPDRIDEGYGPNAPAMTRLAGDHDLIICVDCGTLSHDAIAAGSAADILVLDHHLGGETLPPALAVVNPNRQDEPGNLAHLCAAAVVFLTLVEANRQLRDAGRHTPDLMASLDLVALATVADVAPLIGVNRAFVRQGLKVMARRARPGLVALSDLARLDVAPNAYHLGYVLGPRINAGGRIGAADLGARCLSATDGDEAMALAARLDELNRERRDIEASVSEAAKAQIEARGSDGPLVWAAGDGWHPGVVGIVASRLKEATHRPAVVIGFDGDEGKGSGRSVTGVDLGAAVQRLAHEGLLTKGGGHRMAAGLTVARAALEPAMERLAELLGRQGADRTAAQDLNLDGVLMPRAATADLVETLEAVGPFGAGAPAPRFAFADMHIEHARPVGDRHLKLTVRAQGETARLDAIAFGAFDGPIGPALSKTGGAPVHLAGRLDLNHWRGQTRVQLRLEDAAIAG